MPKDPAAWRRIELPADLYRELEAEAKAVHMSAQAYARYLIARGIQRERAQAEVPMRDRKAQQ